MSESYVDRATTVKRRVQQGLALDELYEALREDEAGLSEVRECAEWPLAEQVEALQSWRSGACETLREAVNARRPVEAADVRKFTTALKAWLERATKTWTAGEREAVPDMLRAIADDRRDAKQLPPHTVRCLQNGE